MSYIEDADRSQVLLLPEAVDDYVGPDNPVRFIDAFVDGIDLKSAGFVRSQAKATGRPGYHPRELLKLYIYGYLNRARSSRRLSAEAHRKIEVIWLLRRLKPDFNTIADFRRDNRKSFKQVFREFVLLCLQLDLFERDLAVSDERLTRYFKELDGSDSDDDGGSSGQSIERLREKIERLKKYHERLEGYREDCKQSGEDQLSLTDFDARAIYPSSRVGVGYKIQIAVDAKHKLIVEQEVHSKVSDMGLLTETAQPAKDILNAGEIDFVADKGYFVSEDIEACDSLGISPYVPKPRQL